MRKIKNIRSAFSFFVVVLASSPGYAMNRPNSEYAMDPVVLASVITAGTTPSSRNADGAGAGGASNLFWVLGGSLVALSLVTRRLSV